MIPRAEQPNGRHLSGVFSPKVRADPLFRYFQRNVHNELLPVAFYVIGCLFSTALGVCLALRLSSTASDGERGFQDGRLHSFRHAFCSTCTNNGVPERMLMGWLGHANLAMLRHYYHLHDAESKRQMDVIDFLGGAGGRSDSADEVKPMNEDVEPPASEKTDDSTPVDWPSIDPLNWGNQKRRPKHLL